MNKHIRLQKRKKRIRLKLRRKKIIISPYPRLCVHRSNKYTSAQIIDDTKGVTLLSFSSKLLSASQIKGKTKSQQAKIAGKIIAKEALAKKITKIFFDRGGYKYHGRVKALAQGLKKTGLKF